MRQLYIYMKGGFFMLKNVYFDYEINCLALELDEIGTVYNCAYIDENNKYIDFAIFDAYELLNNEHYLNNVIEQFDDYDIDELHLLLDAADCAGRYKYIVEIDGDSTEYIRNDSELIDYINNYEHFY